MSKAVAIPYIIALIIGIILLGVVGYWFLGTASKGAGVTNEAYCKGKLTQYCSDWSTGKTPGKFSEYASECSSSFIGTPGWPKADLESHDDCIREKILGF